MKKLLVLGAFLAFGYMGANAQTPAVTKPDASPAPVNVVVTDDSATPVAPVATKEGEGKKKDKCCSESKSKSCAGEKKSCCSKDSHGSKQKTPAAPATPATPNK